MSASGASANSTMVLSFTLGSTAATYLTICTRVHTILIDAGLVIRTLRIEFTFGFEALDLRITAPSRWAIANWAIILNTTFGITSAWIGFGTGILTTLVYASCCWGTFRIVAASRCYFGWLIAIDKRIALSVLRT